MMLNKTFSARFEVRTAALIMIQVRAKWHSTAHEEDLTLQYFCLLQF
jgi:hypothetical protein